MGRSSKGLGKTCSNASCKRCRSDRAFLRRKKRPDPVTGPAMRVVDLFCGCGGMSIGLAEAARRSRFRLEVPLALDSDEAAVQIYKTNMPGAEARVGDVAACFDGESGAPLTFVERKTQESVGKVDVLLGGPPCQGHSDLNNHTRRNDPKNALYLLMARAATVLQPKVVVVENVVPVQRDKSGVVQATAAALTQAGYAVAGRVLDLRRVGVPQRRRRYVMLASAAPEVAPDKLLESLAKGLHQHPDRSVHWAIADLAGLEAKTTYDTASRANEENRRRIDYLFGHDTYDLPNSERPECHRDRDHSYVSMYGRLRWNAPAQTITTGFGSMGQGRYVHPAEHRTLTPHEAARLQTFPDWFSFGEKSPRSVLAKMIGNAVPPLLMIELGSRILGGLAAAASVPQRKHA